MNDESVSRVLEPGRNCWRLTHARRAAFLIDGADYFAAFRAAVREAHQSILIVGWDLDSRVRLLRDDAPHALPVALGEFLNAVVSRRRGLQAHVLIWDFAMLYTLEREILPVYRLQWRSPHRLHFHMDDSHPVGASHHQKIVVVDDALAFVGGLDLTKRRWDTPEHAPSDPRRQEHDGVPYGPFHDVQMMVDGEAAAALGDLARERWRRATGQALRRPTPDGNDPWPQGFEADLEDAEVAIARTEPAYKGKPAVREVERLYLDAVASARRTLYIENQYLTSAVIGQALARRLRDDQGPEVVLALPHECSGWLEHTTMDVLRARLLRQLREADRHGRLRVYHPVVPDGGCVYVHSKLMITDEDLLCVGSANLSNRSMALDTECILAVEAGGDEHTARAIAQFRNRLLAEHLGVATDRVAQVVGERGSLIAAIEGLRGGGRSLEELEGSVPEALDQTIPDAALIDPEEPLDPERLVGEFVPEEEREPARRRLVIRAAIAVLLLALAAAWRWTPLGEWLDADTLARWVGALRDSPLGPVAMVAGFLVGGLIVFPVTALIVIAALVFGPVLGFACALIGVMASAAATFGLGHSLGRDAVRSLGGSRINRLSRQLAKRGVITVAVVRMLPIAPFTVVNLVAGASHIGFRDFLLGTLAGMVPGMLGLTLFADRLYSAVRNPEPANLALLAGVVAALVAGVLWVRRWLRGRGSMGAQASGGKE